MGKRGPRAKPTSLKLLEGSSDINNSEPVPAQSEVQAPEWLVEMANESEGDRESALDVWNRLSPDLHRKGVLTPWDVDEFAVFCDAVVNHRAAAMEVRKYGLLVRGAKGNLVKNPATQLTRDYADVMVKIGARFGLSPSDRADLKIEREAPHGGADRLLS